MLSAAPPRVLLFSGDPERFDVRGAARRRP